MYQFLSTSLLWDELIEGEFESLKLADKQLIVVKKNNQAHAFAATCPHAGASFCEGWLDAHDRLVCPLHKYRFDIVNGRNTTGEGYKLKIYPTKIEENIIFIGIW
ncbi:MAG: Rieske (2Fe-2S) protein [Bacteroidota bacterium]|jgi:nitrite reductase/ring-hydroxylating ferredoxin subunit